jgi:hypothetical protein
MEKCDRHSKTCNLEKQHVEKVGESGYKWKVERKEHFCQQSQLMTS